MAPSNHINPEPSSQIKPVFNPGSKTFQRKGWNIYQGHPGEFAVDRCTLGGQQSLSRSACCLASEDARDFILRRISGKHLNRKPWVLPRRMRVSGFKFPLNQCNEFSLERQTARFQFIEKPSLRLSQEMFQATQSLGISRCPSKIESENPKNNK